MPEVRAGETQVRQLTITATEDNAAAEATVIVNQERTVAAALRLRMDPSAPRVRDSESTVVTLIVDNRGATTARTVQFEGRDPEGVVRFAFANRTLPVPAGRAITTSVRISAPPPPTGKESSKPFSVLAIYGDGEVEATGTFAQSTSVTAYSVSRLTVTPETLRSDEPQGQLQFCIENRHESQWLQAGMSGTDLEGVVQFEFSPPGFDVPPGGEAWGLVSVSAPAPAKRDEEATRQLEITASNDHESLTTKATFIHSGWDWIPIVQAALIVFGGVAGDVGRGRAVGVEREAVQRQMAGRIELVVKRHQHRTARQDQSVRGHVPLASNDRPVRRVFPTARTPFDFRPGHRHDRDGLRQRREMEHPS